MECKPFSIRQLAQFMLMKIYVERLSYLNIAEIDFLLPFIRLMNLTARVILDMKDICRLADEN